MKIKISLVFVMLTLMLVGAYSQGVTTSSISGRVVDKDGKSVYPANVVTVHTPSNTMYGAITQSDGYYKIVNMRIGGPYTVTISFVGYQTGVHENVFLELNQTTKVDMTLIEGTKTLEEVIITDDNDALFDPDRKGASTNIGEKQIINMPTIKRSQKDLTRLTPQSDGYSFGGRNNLYNNFSVDGSIFNNSFGLDYATPGGQTDAQPVSLDAIEQIQVSLAPFDVRQGGFTGAGVNAVTKSGTNNFKASVYYYLKNEKLIGKKVGSTDSPNNDFNDNQFGFTVGGPIVKNSLFFFVSAETERRNELAHGWIADNGENAGQANVTSVYEADLIAIQARLRDYWGYDPGAFQGYNHKKSNDKVLAKLSWNISPNQRVSIRYNMLDAWKEELPHPEAVLGRGPTSYRMPFENSSYTIFNKINSIMAEWTSNYNNKWSNKMMAGYTSFRDTRVPKSTPFPVVDIFDVNGNIAITFGSEMFSTNNVLNQDVYQFTNDITYFADKHTITGGLNVERFYFENCFNLFYYPWDMFFSVNDFLNNKKIGDPDYNPNVDIDFNNQVLESTTKSYRWSYVDVAQLAIYLQDEYQVNPKLNLSFGLRMDMPVYLASIPVTAAVDEVVNFEGWVDEQGNPAKVDPARWPNNNPLWSPRIGFNWDILSNSTLQLRGGTGIFSGRIPFVWLGNQASNSGIYPGYTFQVNGTAQDFSFPQIWKTNVAVDWKTRSNWIFGIEGIFGKDINGVVHRNYNMAPPTGQLTGTGDNRQIFTGFNESNIYSSSPDAIGFLDAGTIILDNTNEGFQHSLTGKVVKTFNVGLYFNAAYTYMTSKDYTSIPAEIAADAFQRNPVVGNPNNPMLSWSRYGLRHRFITSAYYSIDYSFMSSTLGFFFESGQGHRYSFVYAGDLNQDAIMNNDLLYVPENSSDIHFGTIDEYGVGHSAANASYQWAALSSFIDQDRYLKNRKGEYAERNGATLPWFTQIDIKYMHDFKFKIGDKTNIIQLSFDIINFGNLLNSNWGVYKLARTTTPITIQGVNNEGVPYFSFDENLKESYIQDVSIKSKWQMQFGVRYIFN
ncbi:MAG: TonB-dependent receptor [Bacteroidetes bacterium]|nr:TonB-dependent receptor [Bacteroidota bacterium]MBL6943076.1 TonB-dependent receptor [Bacteroidales bacterium]